MTDHPDLDALSAIVDGAPPGTHVEGCEACRSRLDRLRAARDAVGTPVPPLDQARREAAIARALAAAGEGAVAAGEGGADPDVAPRAGPPVGPLQPPAAAETGGRRRWYTAAAAAAVVAVALGTAGLLGTLGSPRDDTATFGSTAENATRDAAGDAAGEAAPQAGPAGRAGAGVGDGPVVDAGDLGDVAGLEALRARVSATAAPLASAASPTTGPPAPAPRQVGTRVCELEIRAARPELGPLVYAATLRYQATPAVVLGFAATPGTRPGQLLVLAPEQGCRLLGETALR